jgi:2-amino-4-hydroxy-6-hydroxymethyldihydropteridine diphosphokinase
MTHNGNTSQVVLLLGSNIDPERNLPEALALLAAQLEVERVSSLWRTAAVGSDGPPFLNAAVRVRTDLDPDQLKDLVLRPIEARLGRVRTADKYAPRHIDLDIAAWDGRVTDPDVWRYAHAAVPAAEVLPCGPVSESGQTLPQAALRLARATAIHYQGELSLSLSS